MSNRIKYRFFSVLYGIFRSKAFRYRKLAIGALIAASACSGGDSQKAEKSLNILPDLKVIELPEKDSVLQNNNTYVPPVDTIERIPPACYSKPNPVTVQPTCYDMPTEPTCYDIVVPENE